MTQVAGQIAEAIKQMQDAMLNGDTTDQAVQQAASDFKLAPALLSRKFEEQHGCSPEKWRNQPALQSKNFAVMSEAKIEERRQALYERWHEVTGVDDNLGEPFSLRGITYWFCTANEHGDVIAFNETGGSPIKLDIQSDQERQALLEGIAKKSARRRRYS